MEVWVVEDIVGSSIDVGEGSDETMMGNVRHT